MESYLHMTAAFPHIRKLLSLHNTCVLLCMLRCVHSD